MDCADMYHASGFLSYDPFTYIEAGERRILVVFESEVERAAAASQAHEVWGDNEFGWLQSVMGTESAGDATRRVTLAAVRRAGLDAVAVPGWYPLGLAEHLRDNGIRVRADDGIMTARRRTKTPRQIEHITDTLRVTERSMSLIREMLAESRRQSDGTLLLEGRPLTSERVQGEVRAFWARHACEGLCPIVAFGGQAADGFETGHGPLRADGPITCDLFPRSTVSRYCADMTRVFCVGEPSKELLGVHEVVRGALDVARGACRPGVVGADVFRTVCEYFQDAGYPTPHSAEYAGLERRQVVAAPYLGHGLGLDVHELSTGIEPYDHRPLLENDVITTEPELFRLGWGAVRLEDVVVITADGCRLLTGFDYEMRVG